LDSWSRNLTFIWIGAFVGLAGANLVFPFLPFYIQELGVESDGEAAIWTGILATATGLTMFLSAPVWGSLADRYGRKPMVIRALIGAGVTMGLMGAAQSVWHLLVLRLFMGAFAGTMGASAALVASTAPERRVTSSLGILQTALFSANTLGPVIGGVLASTIGIRESFFFTATLYLCAAGLTWLFVDEDFRRPARDERQRHSLAANVRAVMASSQLAFVMLLLFTLWLSTTLVRPVIPLSIDAFGGELNERQMSGIALGALGLTSTFAALSVGRVSSRLGLKGGLMLATAGAGLFYLPVPLAESVGVFIVLLAAVGLFQGAMVPTTNSMIAKLAPGGRQGSAFGVAASMQSLALMIGPITGGAIAGAVGLDAVYVVVAALLLVMTGAQFFLLQAPSERAQPSATAEALHTAPSER
jgi:DHA1 family multidrug resistance protein-like MFS transporter